MNQLKDQDNADGIYLLSRPLNGMKNKLERIVKEEAKRVSVVTLNNESSTVNDKVIKERMNLYT